MTEDTFEKVNKGIKETAEGVKETAEEAIDPDISRPYKNMRDLK